jgi:hypothetical protein
VIFQWSNNPGLRRHEQLMAIIYDLGIVTIKQLQIITGWNIHIIKQAIKRTRMQSEALEEKELWIRSFSMPGRAGLKAYALGKNGVKYVHDLRQMEQRIRETPEAQITHYLGITNILTRLLEHNLDRNKIAWYSTIEATDTLFRLLERKRKEVDKKTLIRPDARLIWDGKHKFWIEFDNDTEGPRKLERKFHNYVQTLSLVDEKSPILWITTSEKRQEYLYKNWEAVKNVFYKNYPNTLPEMHFFTESQETEFILKRVKSPPLLRRN